VDLPARTFDLARPGVVPPLSVVVRMDSGLLTSLKPTDLCDSVVVMKILFSRFVFVHLKKTSCGVRVCC